MSPTTNVLVNIASGVAGKLYPAKHDASDRESANVMGEAVSDRNKLDVGGHLSTQS